MIASSKNSRRKVSTSVVHRSSGATVAHGGKPMSLGVWRYLPTYLSHFT